jgi:Zn-dependent protease with chaperone function
LAQGQFFPAGAARHVPAQLAADGDALAVLGKDGTVLATAPLKSIDVSSRLGTLKRRLVFAGQGIFETADNDAVDALTRRGLLHAMEKSWPIAAAAVLCAIAAAAWFGFYGAPLVAGALARNTPPPVARFMTSQTLNLLDDKVLLPTKLAADRQRWFDARFAAVAKFKGGSYQLLLRNAPLIGPNAFALPDGRIVMTDQLAAMIQDPQEIDGVFAHEMAHVARLHVLQRVYQASLVPAVLVFITGDPSQVSHFATILPGVLLQSAYSRQFEQQADDDAAALLKAHGEDPGKLANLLERITAKICQGGDCGPNWLGSHPATAARAARLRGH